MAAATDRKLAQKHPPGYFTSAQKQSLRRKILTWYAHHARDLPWRASDDPYCVWISEVMLQQTQVATVRAYFKRFIHELPDVHRLAAADERQVLRLWEGLGYYRRARQLHAAARMIVADYEGKIPEHTDELMKLPGVGRYTAGAIASIAFGQRAPILEANTIRLLSRLIAYREDPLKSAGQHVLWQVAAEILPRTNVARFNQALMELGSLVCAASTPRCDECPLATVCAAFVAGLQREIPLEKPPQKFTAVHEAAVVVCRNGRILVRKCSEGERWAGLWDFPRFALAAEGPLFARDEIIAKVCAQSGVRCSPGNLLKTIKHGVTRYRITLDCYQAEYESGQARGPARWIKTAELADLPLSTTGRKIVGLVNITSPQIRGDARRYE